MSAQLKEVIVPDIGEFKDVEIIEVLVKPGDVVKAEDSLITLESDKAAMEVPSPAGGTVQSLKVKAGDRVNKGSPILVLELVGEASTRPEPSPAVAPAPAPAPSVTAAPAAAEVRDIVVPDIGDFKDVEVIEVLVKPGDVVRAEDSLVTLESDKAAMEVPAPVGGTVMAVKVKAGDRVSQGTHIVSLEVTAAAPAAPSGPPLAPVAPRGEEPEVRDVLVPDIGDFKDVEVIEVLVKVGDVIRPETSLITLESDKAAMEVPAPMGGTVRAIKVKAGDRVNKGSPILTVETAGAVPAPVAVTAAAAPKRDVEPARVPGPVAAPASRFAESQSVPPHASPAIRRFARELGADLTRITGTGPKGRILKEDVQRFVKEMLKKAAEPAVAPASGFALPPIPEVDFSRFGPIDARPLTRIQKLSGPNLHRNWISIPHITQHDEADITELEDFRQSLKAEADRRGVKVSFLPFVLKAVAAALKAFPTFNASLGANGESLILKQYFHIGVAVDTPEGLVVPVLRNVDQKSVFDLAAELAELSGKARAKKLRGPDLEGGCFTISSLGGIGGTHFTPIINAPEVAILGLSKTQMKPVWRDGQFVPRLMLPLSVSYDHRVIDGAEGARFTVHLANLLADLRRVLL